MKIDKSHSKYKEYIDKCKKIAKTEINELNKVPIKHQRDGETDIIHRKYTELIKKLKKEYSFLFLDD